MFRVNGIKCMKERTERGEHEMQSGNDSLSGPSNFNKIDRSSFRCFCSSMLHDDDLL